jgi:DNA-binding transcriptional MerR regulator
VSQVELPDKLFFKIGEVARIAGVKQHVLRYWETEFSSIRPQKSKSNQRLYRRRDVEAILAVKHLLWERKFTIEGAKRHLKQEGVGAALPPPDPDRIAARVKQEAEVEMKDAEDRLRADLVSRAQRDLLFLRQMATDFLKKLDSIDE